MTKQCDRGADRALARARGCARGPLPGIVIGSSLISVIASMVQNPSPPVPDRIQPRCLRVLCHVPGSRPSSRAQEADHERSPPRDLPDRLDPPRRTLRLSFSCSNDPEPPSTEGETYSWTWERPLPQGNDLSDAAWVDGSTAVAVGASGSIIRSSDGGTIWDLVSTGGYHHLSAVSFGSEDRGITVGAAVLTSSDGGRSWREVNTDLTASDVDMASASRAMMVGDAGCAARSDDGGCSTRRFTPEASGQERRGSQTTRASSSRESYAWESGTRRPRRQRRCSASRSSEPDGKDNPRGNRP
jgi:hypothetical protein